jgi:hypothetical protein
LASDLLPGLDGRFAGTLAINGKKKGKTGARKKCCGRPFRELANAAPFTSP